MMIRIVNIIVVMMVMMIMIMMLVVSSSRPPRPTSLMMMMMAMIVMIMMIMVIMIKMIKLHGFKITVLICYIKRHYVLHLVAFKHKRAINYIYIHIHIYVVRILINKNLLKNKAFSTCRSRVNFKKAFLLFISASYNAVNPIQNFKITITQRDNSQSA